ncbi:hypothetical protein HD554DRAFT_1527091 [Boletus coccyginus]|nr:hypothetical protein HD554DRAFT_1527091 [Boletus coccyginus]
MTRRQATTRRSRFDMPRRRLQNCIHDHTFVFALRTMCVLWSVTVQCITRNQRDMITTDVPIGSRDGLGRSKKFESRTDFASEPNPDKSPFLCKHGPEQDPGGPCATRHPQAQIRGRLRLASPVPPYPTPDPTFASLVSLPLGCRIRGGTV